MVLRCMRYSDIALSTGPVPQAGGSCGCSVRILPTGTCSVGVLNGKRMTVGVTVEPICKMNGDYSQATLILRLWLR